MKILVIYYEIGGNMQFIPEYSSALMSDVQTFVNFEKKMWFIIF